MLRYRSRISGPLLDRIDIYLDVPAVPPEDLTRPTPGESSSIVRKHVEKAHARMIARQEKDNVQLTPREIEHYCALDEIAAALLKQAISRLGLSARGYHRTLKLARPIADLAGAEHLTASHLAEAIQYRRFDRTDR